MKKSHKFFRSLSLLFMVAVLLFSSLTPTYAASNGTYKTIVANRKGEISLGQSVKTKFTLKAKAKVKISFLGYDYDTSKGTYGRYQITIKNASGKKVYSKIGETGFDNKKHVTPELPKGKYTFILQVAKANGFSYYSDELEYNYTLSYLVTAKTAIKKVTTKPATLNLKVGAKKALTANLTPAYATNTVTWNSSNKKVATVNKKGLVTAKALGTAKITAKAGGKTGTCKVKVTSMEVTAIKKKYRNLNSYITNIANYKRATWKSSNTGIATVDNNGKVYGKSYGKCDIYCTISGVKYTFKLSVKPAVSIGFSSLADTGIYNEVCLKFRNNTNVDVTYVTLNIYQYDNRGARLASPYDYYYVNDTIDPYETEVYEFWVNDSTKKVTYAITKVWFSNGTTWTP